MRHLCWNWRRPIEVPPSDDVDEHAEEGKGNGEDRPHRLGEAAEIVAPEDVPDDVEQQVSQAIHTKNQSMVQNIWSNG